MRIIPAIDIIDGKCVRLTKGDYATKKVYHSNPVEIAKEFEAAGIQYLHVVDLDGAKSDRIINHSVLEKIASQTNLIIDFGGGLKKSADIRIAFESGVSQITAGSIAVKNRQLVLEWIQEFGPDKIILGADCLNRNIAISGWQENSKLDVIDFIKTYQNSGLTSAICTDVSKDGMLQGPSFGLYKEILDQTKIQLIASGGVSIMEDVVRLQQMGCHGTIIGKALYEGNITLKQLSDLC